MVSKKINHYFSRKKHTTFGAKIKNCIQALLEENHVQLNIDKLKTSNENNIEEESPEIIRIDSESSIQSFLNTFDNLLQ